MGKGQTKTNGMSRGTGKVEDKIERNKGADLKGPLVTQRVISTRRKDEKEGYETFEQPKGHTFEGSPNDLLFSFKYWKVKTYREFLPRKNL